MGRHAHTAVVEANHPAERGQAAVEAIHRGLGIDRVDGDERPRQHEQIHRAIAEFLVGDVHVAALGVTRARRLCHQLRLFCAEAFRLAFTRQSESAVAGLLDEPIDQKRVQRPVALRDIRQPRQIEVGPRNRRLAGAQHIQ